jgi:hypothetical protein
MVGGRSSERRVASVLAPRHISVPVTTTTGEPASSVWIGVRTSARPRSLLFPTTEVYFVARNSRLVALAPAVRGHHRHRRVRGRVLHEASQSQLAGQNLCQSQRRWRSRALGRSP